MTKIKVEHLNKTFKDLKALNDVSLDIEDGDIVCLIGPSGSGKSTLCRCIHGLEIPDSGKIYLDNELMDRTNKQNHTDSQPGCPRRGRKTSLSGNDGYGLQRSS